MPTPADPLPTRPLICELWFKTVERYAEIYGQPLPQDMLQLGDPNRGWHTVLNTTRQDRPNHPAYTIAINWGGLPAGLIGADGGCIAAGSAANEDTFRDWLKTADRPQG